MRRLTALAMRMAFYAPISITERKREIESDSRSKLTKTKHYEEKESREMKFKLEKG